MRVHVLMLGALACLSGFSVTDTLGAEDAVQPQAESREDEMTLPDAAKTSVPDETTDDSGRVLLKLKDAGDIADATLLYEATDAVTQAVTPCVEAGESAESCQCKNLPVLRAFQKTFAATLDEHPDWAEKTIYYEVMGEDNYSDGYNLMMPIMAKQARMVDALRCQ